MYPASAIVPADLSIAIVSITPTVRRRFFWAVWWSRPPAKRPFTKPDASSGGAHSREEALAAAELASGRPLTEVDGVWARGWKRSLRGDPPFTPLEEARLDGEAPAPRAQKTDRPESIWQVLGVPQTATPLEIRRAYKQRCIETHPDRGGDASRFRLVQHAFAEATVRAARPRSKRGAAKGEPDPQS
jgi:hypothetical protein